MMSGKSTALKLLGLGVLLAFPFIPFLSSEYVVHVAVLIMVYAVLAMGLNVLPGFCDLLDLGYVGFYGIGAYTAGILSLNYDMSFWVVVPLAAALGALCGVLRGAPTLRLSGDYFAIVTFGFTELVVLFLTNEIWLTRGPLGMPGIPPIDINLAWLGIDWRYDFMSETPYYYLGLLMVAFVYVVMCRIEDSRLGRAWLAIKEDPLAAASCGINLMAYKSVAFAFSAAVGALAGCFMARWSMFLAPDVFKFWESFLVLCMIVLGGLGNIKGAIVGSIVLIALGEVLRVVLPHFGLPTETRFLAYGLLMILIMRFKPGGFFPAIAATSKKSRLIMDLKARLLAERAG